MSCSGRFNGFKGDWTGIFRDYDLYREKQQTKTVSKYGVHPESESEQAYCTLCNPMSTTWTVLRVTNSQCKWNCGDDIHEAKPEGTEVVQRGRIPDRTQKNNFRPISKKYDRTLNNIAQLQTTTTNAEMGLAEPRK